MTIAATNTIGQADRKTEFPRLDLGDVTSLFIVYHAKVSGFATVIKPVTLPPEAEPSTDQLSSLSAPVKSNAIPDVDFVVWVPYACRLRKRRTTSGYHIGPDRKLHLVYKEGGDGVARNAQALRRSCTEARQHVWFFLLVVAVPGSIQNAHRRI